MGIRRWIPSATVAIALAAPAAAKPPPFQLPLQSYQYTAETHEPARRQGTVVAGGFVWTCEGAVCTITGPWVRPAVGACRALAQQVGPIRAYGRPGAMLSPSDIASCNAGQTPTESKSQKPLPPRKTAISPSGGPVSITTPELSFVGGSMIDTSARGAPVVVTVPELSFVGGTQIERKVSGPVEVNTPELSFVGEVAPRTGKLPDLTPRSAPAAVTITTPELSFVGGTMIDTSGRGAPVIVDVPELSFVGGAQITRKSNPPVEVNTPELSFVGQ